jgi:hypothetical protein
MEDVPKHRDQEQGEKPLPSVPSAYQLYNDDKLQEFVEQAFLLEEVELTRYHMVQLLILVANCVRV